MRYLGLFLADRLDVEHAEEIRGVLTLPMIDVIFSQDGGQRHDVIMSDTGSYSEMVIGLAQLLGIEYRSALADLPDQRGWPGTTRRGPTERADAVRWNLRLAAANRGI